MFAYNCNFFHKYTTYLLHKIDIIFILSISQILIYTFLVKWYLGNWHFFKETALYYGKPCMCRICLKVIYFYVSPCKRKFVLVSNREIKTMSEIAQSFDFTIYPYPLILKSARDVLETWKIYILFWKYNYWCQGPCVFTGANMLIFCWTWYILPE